MRPGFALSLSFEGISLLHNTADGWHKVGDVSLDSPDLGADLSVLRTTAENLDPGNLYCQIIVPNDQIRYLTFDSGAFSGDALTQMARAALDGATPYPVDELAFDLSVDGDRTHVAAVARETLSEAEAFAVDHAFNPVSFVAMPPVGAFVGEPSFGATTFARTLPVPQPDDQTPTLAPTGDQPPQADATSGDTDHKEPVASGDDAPVIKDEPSTAPPTAGFSTRRSRRQIKAATTAAVAGADRDAILPPAPAASSVSDSGDAKPPAVSVSAPHLDVPDLTHLDDPLPDAAAPEPANGYGGFLSRRKQPAAAVRPASAAPAPQVAPPPVSAIAELGPEDETARMTIFGARPSDPVQGRPRRVGLMLTAVLLLVLAAIAAWAVLFLDKDLASLFRSAPDETELAAEPEPPAPDVLARGPNQLESPSLDSATSDAATPYADPPAPETTSAPATAAAPPGIPSLTDADSAVLEALRQLSASRITELATKRDPDPETPAQTAARYAVTGIWPTPPAAPETPAIIGLDDLYVASIDRTDLSQDAVALPPAPDLATDQPPGTVTSPAAAGTAFDLDARGLVVATAAGTLNPDGIIVYLGRPPLVPPRIPTRFETEPELDVLRDRLADLRPRLRPDDLIERAERSRLGGLSRAELGTVRPKPRPRSVKQIAEQDETPTAQAVVVSRVPRTRPASFASVIRKPTTPSTTQPKPVATVVPQTVSPSIPSRASVARQATLDNAINLRRVNLIGVYGTPSNRRALVRLPSGRYKKVKVGDRVDGGRVLAIGDSELRYQKSGRNVTLKIPSG